MTVLHHQLDGPVDGPPLILGPALGTTLSVWDAPVLGWSAWGVPVPADPVTEGNAFPAPDDHWREGEAGLAGRHRVVRWDLPGHGGTPSGAVPAHHPGATGIADLAARVLELADHLGLDRFGYAGVSLGGAVGGWLAVHHPERISALALVCSSARFGDPDGWVERAALVRRRGTGVLVDGARERWFTPGFAERHPEVAGPLLDGLAEVDPAGYAACCDALAGHDLRDRLGRIAVSTLVLAGDRDIATPEEHARELAAGVPESRLLRVPGAAHLAPCEQPGPVTAALLAHFAPRT